MQENHLFKWKYDFSTVVLKQCRVRGVLVFTWHKRIKIMDHFISWRKEAHGHLLTHFESKQNVLRIVCSSGNIGDVLLIEILKFKAFQFSVVFCFDEVQMSNFVSQTMSWNCLFSVYFSKKNLALKCPSPFIMLGMLDYSRPDNQCFLSNMEFLRVTSRVN